MDENVLSRFRLDGSIVVITGGAGKLGVQHSEAIVEAGGIPVLLDIDVEKIDVACDRLKKGHPGSKVHGVQCDITKPEEVQRARDDIRKNLGDVEVLINNAANNPHVTDMQSVKSGHHWSQFEAFPLNIWEKDIAVCLTGAFLCSQIFGNDMAQNKKGVILNIASDLSVIAPDQRLYKDSKRSDKEQVVKPVGYSVVKSGLIGLTKYLSTYWAHAGVRVNALSFGGIYSSDLDPVFVSRLENLIPLARMAKMDEYKAAVLFMISDASCYMTGQNMIVDGGRSVW